MPADPDMSDAADAAGSWTTAALPSAVLVRAMKSRRFMTLGVSAGVSRCLSVATRLICVSQADEASVRAPLAGHGQRPARSVGRFSNSRFGGLRLAQRAGPHVAMRHVWMSRQA